MSEHAGLTCAQAQLLMDHYREENQGLTEALATLTVLLPAGSGEGSTGNVAIPIRRLLLARDVARGKAPADMTGSSTSTSTGMADANG